MATELEYKLHIHDEAELKKILADADIAAMAYGDWRETQMRTTYFDTQAHSFLRHHWTLRRRQEGSRSVVCLKTPVGMSRVRGEFQVEAEQIDENAIVQLIAAGAPEQLLPMFCAAPLVPICGASFLRRSVMLRFSDSSNAELAGDCGFLNGRSQQLNFTELEHELYEGKPDAMAAFVNLLCSRYELREEALSKYARARKLK